MQVEKVKDKIFYFSFNLYKGQLLPDDHDTWVDFIQEVLKMLRFPPLLC